MYVVSNNTPKSSTLYFSTAKKNSKCGLPKIFFFGKNFEKNKLKTYRAGSEDIEANYY